jgi:hypothetical protein
MSIPGQVRRSGFGYKACTAFWYSRCTRFHCCSGDSPFMRARQSLCHTPRRPVPAFVQRDLANSERRRSVAEPDPRDVTTLLLDGPAISLSNQI